MVLPGLNTLTNTIFTGRIPGGTALAGTALANPFNAVMLSFGYWIRAANLLNIALGKNNIITQKRHLPIATIQDLLSRYYTARIFHPQDLRVKKTKDCATVLTTSGLDCLVPSYDFTT